MSKLAAAARELGLEMDEGIEPDEAAASASGGAQAVAAELMPGRQSLRGHAPTRPSANPPPPPRADDLPGGGESYGDMMIREQESELQLPLILNARVVYIGASRKKCIPLKGRVLVETWQEAPDVEPEVNKTPTEEEGITGYDFTTHDIRGRVILTNLIGPTEHPRIRNRMSSLVEHPEHLRQFLRMRDANGEREFEVLVPKRVRAQFLDYVAEKERMIGKRHALIEATAKERE